MGRVQARRGCYLNAHRGRVLEKRGGSCGVGDDTRAYERAGVTLITEGMITEGVWSSSCLWARVLWSATLFFLFLSDTTLVPRHLSHRPSWTAPLLSSFFWLESSCSFPDCALMRVWKGSWTTQWNSTRQSAIHAGLRWMKMSLFAKLVGICGNDPPTTILLIVLLRFKDLRNCSRDGLIIGDFSFLYSKYFFSYVLKITHFEYLLSLKLIDAELIILNFSGQTLTVYFMEILC